VRVGEAGEGVNVTTLRELALLRELRHPHIVRLLAAFPARRSVSLVFEYAESDLEEVVRDRAIVLAAGDVKAYMRMALAALAACHAAFVVHRDVKVRKKRTAGRATFFHFHVPASSSMHYD
jgi:cyclin-dependent kinase 7